MATYDAYYAAVAADKAFQAELERVYGKAGAGHARYLPHHDDPAVAAAKARKLAADDTWHLTTLHR